MTIAIRVGSKTFHVSNTPPKGTVDPSVVAAFRRLRLDELAIDGLRRLLVEETTSLARRFASDVVREEVAKRLLAGRWTIVLADTPQIRMDQSVAQPGQNAAPSNKDPLKTTKKDWIEVELIDKNKKPVKGLKVELTLPSGETTSGTLSDRGSFRKDGIDPGTCKVRFPDLDGREWAKSGNFADGTPVELFKGPPKIGPGPYTVKQGDHIASITHDAGFLQWKTIWDDGKNASIKALRNPNVLYPGDVIEIPARQKKEESAPTGEYHTFQTIGDPVELKIVLLDWAGRPMVDADLQLQIDSDEKLKTGGDGSAKKKVDPAGPKEGKLTVNTYQMAVRIGHLDPVEEFPGQVWRLNNLGYRAGEPADPQDKQFLSAVEEFQCDHSLTVDGICGPNTQNKLKEVHGS